MKQKPHKINNINWKVIFSLYNGRQKKKIFVIF